MTITPERLAELDAVMAMLGKAPLWKTGQWFERNAADLRAHIDALAATIARLRGALDSERSRANADVLGCVNPLEMDDLLARLKRIEATLTGAQ